MSKSRMLKIKILLCCLAISVVISFVIKLLWPTQNLETWAIYMLAGWGILVGFVLVLFANIAVWAWINQWVLRKGGTDTQWLWFPADPPGVHKHRKPKQR